MPEIVAGLTRRVSVRRSACQLEEAPAQIRYPGIRIGDDNPKSMTASTYNRNDNGSGRVRT